jgi:hypothetical protein
VSQVPKTLLYRDALAAVENQIVAALPKIVEGLIAQAKRGDTKAAVYLCDRILGRAAGLKTAPADDRRAPYSEDEFRLDQQHRDQFKFILGGLGASDGA